MGMTGPTSDHGQAPGPSQARAPDAPAARGPGAAPGSPPGVSPGLAATPATEKSALLPRLLLGLLGAAMLALAIGLYLTRGGDPALEYNAPPPLLPNTAGLVDQTPLSTARTLAALAGTRQEQEYARQALELADHEVDQDFAEALHQATAHPPALTGAALKVAERLSALAPQIAGEQQQVAALAKAAAAAPLGAAAAQQQIAEAQLALDQDERDDLRQDLIRMGGDRRSRVQQALDEHEALQKQSASLPQNTATAALESQENLRTVQGKLAAFGSLNRRHALLLSARADALSMAAQLSQQHDLLDKATSATYVPVVPQPPARTAPAGSSLPVQLWRHGHIAATPAAPAPSTTEPRTPPAPGEPGSAARGAPASDSFAAQPTIIGQLHMLAEQRKTLAQYDQRIHEEQQLAGIYALWDAQVVLDRRTVLHRLLALAALIAAMLTLMVAAHLALVRTLERRISEVRRRNHFRVVVETGIQSLGGLLILLALFGPQRQVSAIIGLATAGAAFVMKDFVVAFIGWFVLMGRGGLRVGDLVEIQGVSGEVVEISEITGQ